MAVLAVLKRPRRCISCTCVACVRVHMREATVTAATSGGDTPVNMSTPQMPCKTLQQLDTSRALRWQSVKVHIVDVTPNFVKRVVLIAI